MTTDMASLVTAHMDLAALGDLATTWRDDEGGTYQGWFLWPERLKNFRSLRLGLAHVSSDIEAGTFGSAYKGSSLETVVKGVAEQRQMFKGADHAFHWKPKLRIPDIYEDRTNQLAFGRLLETCRCCTTASQVLTAVQNFTGLGIKGLGPSAANLLYFLHPTVIPPFNTAIVRGYNAVTGSRVRLGRWDDFFRMRAGMVAITQALPGLLSNDLGAVAGLMFDIGTGRFSPPPLGDENRDVALRNWRQQLAARAQLPTKGTAPGSAQDATHNEVQGWLRDLGLALGFDVWIASNDRSRPYAGGRLADGCLSSLPADLTTSPAADSIRLIDVLWLEPNGAVAAAFEVEHTTSIYSGIVRMLDLSLSGDPAVVTKLFLVAPDDREAEVRAQINRPAFGPVADQHIRYLRYSELDEHRGAIARFGSGMHPIERLAHRLS